MFSSHNNQDPKFNIFQMLGFSSETEFNSVPTPISKQLYDERNDEFDSEINENRSWVVNGHPLGNSIDELDLSTLGIGGLIRIAGGGVFGGVLGEQEVFGLDCDPLQLVSNFLSELSENQQVCADYGIEFDELAKISSGIQEACELAEELRNIQTTATEENIKELVDNFALKLKNSLNDKGVIHFPLLDEEGKYAQMVRIDKEHGFSIIQVEENPLGYLSSHENIQSKFEVKNLEHRQDSIAHTYLDPLTKREVETFKSQQFISYSVKDFDRLGDENFFRYLIKGSVYPALLEEGDYNVEGLIHESLPKYVEGKRLEASDQQSQLFRKMYRHFQETDKDTTFNSLSAALYYLSLNPFFNVEEDLGQAVLRYKKVKFLLQSQVFLAYVRRIDQEESWNEVSRPEKMFLNDLMHNLMRSADKLKKIDGITHDQLSGFFATCQQLKGIFERPELVTPDLEVSQSESLARASLCIALPSYQTTDGVQNLTLPPVVPSSFGFSSRTTNQGSTQDIQVKPAESFISDLTTYPYQIDFSTDDLDEHLTNFFENIDHLYGLYEVLSDNPKLRYTPTGHRYALAAKDSVRRAVFGLYERTLQDVVASLPIHSQGGDSYWAKLPPEQTEQWLNLTEAVSELLFRFSALNKEEMHSRNDRTKHSAEESVLVLAIYAIQLQLASNDPDYHLGGQNFSYFRSLMEMRDTRFVIRNPSVRKMINELMHYFNPNWNVEELTRQFSKKDEGQLVSSLFSYVHKTQNQGLEAWKLEFVDDDSKKSADQKYFEMMLDEDGVRDGIIEVLNAKNLELAQQHKRAIESYQRRLNLYHVQKADLEEQIGDLENQVTEITNASDQQMIDRFGDISDYYSDFDRYLQLRTEIEEAPHFRDTSNLQEARDELGERFAAQLGENYLITINSYQEIISAREATLRQPQRELSGCRRELSRFVEPPEPGHPGQYPTDSIIDQLLCLLCDEEGRRLIPEKMNRILQNVLRFQCFNSSPTHRMISETELVSFCFVANVWRPLPLDRQSSRSPLSCRIETSGRLQTRLTGNLRGIDQKNSADKLMTPDDYRLEYRGILYRFNEDYKENLNQNQIIASDVSLYDLSPKKSQELRMLGIDPYDTVSRSIGFFRENISLLSQSEIRKYFEVLLFRPDFLHSQLRDNPQIAEKMNAFILSAARHYKEIKDIKTCVAMIRLGDQFKRATREAIGDDAVFADYRSVILNEIIPTFNDDNAAKLEAYRTLMILHASHDVLSDGYGEEITKKQVIQDLLALRVCQQLQTHPTDISEEDGAIIASTVLRYQPLLQTEIDDSDLTNAVRVAIQDESLNSESLWDEGDEDGVYQFDIHTINVKTGVICSNGKPIVVTPDWITTNETLKRVCPFSFDSHTCERKNAWTYVLFPGDPKNQLEIRSFDDGENVEINKLIDGQSYRFVPTPRELIENMPTVFAQSTVCWESDGQILAYQNGKKAYEISFTDINQVEKSIDSIIRIKDGMIAQNFASMQIDNIGLPQIMLNQLPDQWNISMLRNIFKGFSLGERDSNYIECWMSPDHAKITVDFKRLGLSFEVFPEEIQSILNEKIVSLLPRFAQLNRENAAEISAVFLEVLDQIPVHCQNFPGYSYSLPELMQSFDGPLLPYLTLRSTSGELKVLVPKILDREHNLDDLLSDEQPLEWIDFGVKKVKSNGKTHLDIYSNEVLGQLVQLVMNARQKDFGKMFEILNKINPLEALSEEENRILDAVLGTLFQYNHPEANAIMLKLGLIKYNNALKPKDGHDANEANDQDQGFDFENVESVENIEGIAMVIAYDRYRENVSKTSKFRLSDEEERQVLEHIHTKLIKVLSLNNREAEDDESYGFFKGLAKKAENWLKNKLIPTCALGIAEQRLGARYDALSKGSGKLGIRKVNWFTMPSTDFDEAATPFTAGSAIIELFMEQLEDDATEIYIPDEETINTCLDELEKDPAFWHQNFVTLYYIARSGSDDQRNKLKEELDLTTHLHSPDHNMISWVFAKPGRYPTFEKMNQIVREWRVEDPEKIDVAQNELNQKQEPFDQATSEYERVKGILTQLEDRESIALGDFASHKAMSDTLTSKERELLRLQDSQPLRKNYTINKLQSEINQIKQNIRTLEELQPRLEDARRDARNAEKALDIAEKEHNQAQSKVENEIENCQKKEEELKALVSSISPDSTFFGKIWIVIDRLVKPIFRLIGQVWKSFWTGKKFLNQHFYSVRDIFSTNQVSRIKENMSVDSEFLVEIDRAFDSYLKQHVKTYFDLNHFADHDQDWEGVDGGDLLVEAKLQKEKDALDEYRNEIRIDRIHAQLKGDASLEALQKDLEEKIETVSVSLVHQKETLIWHLNREINSDPESQLTQQLNRLGQKGQLTWDDLRSLTLTGNMVAFREKTGLSETEAKRLLQGVGDYLVKATRLNQLRHVLKIVKKAVSDRDESKRDIYCTNIVEALNQTRQFTPEPSNMAKLWFEYSNQYLYRKDQIDVLERTGAMSADEILMEAPTGFGKSKNYVPTINNEMTENHLVFNVHPRTIEKINAKDNQSQSRDSYGRKVDRLHFQRSTKFSTATLKKLYENMQVDFEERRPINCSAESLQSLELHFLLTMFEYQNMVKDGNATNEEIKNAQEHIGYFIRILRAISVYGWATIDESHVNLNPYTNKLIYTIGDPSTLESYQIELLEEMMDWLVTDEQLCDVARISSNEQARVSEDEYNSISQHMAEKFADKYRISSEHKDEFLMFVQGQLDEVPLWIRQDPHAKKYALIKGVLSLILKSCMDGYVDENFGLSILHFDTKEYAIAYSSSNTPKENEQNPSQFKNPHETMIKTYLTYLHKGLREDQVIKLIKTMHQDQELEVRTGVSSADTQANKTFVEIAGGGYSLNDLKHNEEKMRRLYKDFEYNKEAIFYYIKRIVVPQLKLYDKTLVSTPQNLRSMFGSSTSLSATPQDAATHGPDTTMVPMPGTQGQVSHLFLNNVDSEQKIHRSFSSDPKDVMESVIDTVLNNDHIKCIIDAGGLMRGLSNEYIAKAVRKEIIKRGADIQAIQYFDVKREDFVIMEIESGSLSDPSVSKVSPSKVITIFDQPRCFGSDTKQDEVASALLLVNSRTDKAKAGQGAGRMRQWHLDQGMEVMMTPEDYTDLFNDRDANIGDLLTLWISNLAKQEAKENYQSLLQQMDNELRRPALDRMVGIRSKNRENNENSSIIEQEPDVDKALKLFKKFEPLFVIDDSCDPWRLYAEIPTDTTPEESLDGHLNSTLNRAEKIRGFSSRQRKILNKRLNRYSRRWKTPDAENPNGVRPVSLPHKVKSSKTDTGTQVEVQVEAETEVEKEEEVLVWENQFVRTPSKWSDKIHLFTPGWEKPINQSVFLKRLGNTLSKIGPKNPILKFTFRAFVIGAGSVLAATAASIAGLAWPIVVAVGSALATLGLGYMLYKTFSGWKAKYISNSAYKVRDVMGIYLPRDVRRVTSIFSPNLTVSNNYYALKTPGWKQTPQEPFTQEQKPVFNVVVIQDESAVGEKSLQMMLIDQNDSIYFRRRLQADYESAEQDEAETRVRKIAVFDVTNGFIAVQGKNQFEDGELEDNPEFTSLLAQAKLINGEINYSEEEKDAITALAQPVGSELMDGFIKDFVLKQHPVELGIYDRTELYNAVQAVGE